MSKKWPSLPGFTSLSDQVLVREGEPSDPSTAAATAHHPEVVVIYGWGDVIPKHIVKFSDGFRAIYPHSKQIVVFAPISRAMGSSLEIRTKFMEPVVREIFPNGPDEPGAPKKILLHAMSNTGAINYASTLNYFKEQYGKPFPHQLISMDSTPGSTVLTWDNLVRWSRAMAIGTAGWFPWPFVVTQSIWGVFLLLNRLKEMALGHLHPGEWSRRHVMEETWETKSALKLYMYSKADDLIAWEDVEIHAAQSRERGYETDVEVFEGSGHVGHMRAHPEKYWKSIQEAWERAIGMSKS